MCTYGRTHFQQILCKTSKSSSTKALHAALLSVDSSSLANSMVDIALLLNCCTALTGITGGASNFLNAPYWLLLGGDLAGGDLAGDASGLTSSLMSFMKLSSNVVLPCKNYMLHTLVNTCCFTVHIKVLWIGVCVCVCVCACVRACVCVCMLSVCVSMLILESWVCC